MKNILLTDLLGELTLPGDPTPLSRPAVYGYFKRLKIKVRIQKGVGRNGHGRACVTAKQAKMVIGAFREKHWRKFEEQGNHLGRKA